jgi:hypothetical protein
MDFLKTQLARRGALDVAGQITMASSPEIEEALNLISSDAATLPAFLLQEAKSRLSNVPSILQDGEVRIWLQRDEIRSLVVQSARSAMVSRDYEVEKRSAVESFVQVVEDQDWWGEIIFDFAVAFVVLSLKSKMTPGERVLLDSNAYEHEQLRDQLEGLSRKLDQGATFASGLELQPADAVCAYLEPIIERVDQLRTMVDPSRSDRLQAFAQRVATGNLRTAPTDLRIKLFRATAASLCRDNRPEEALQWIDAARDAGANDLDTDRARYLNSRGNHTAAIDLLRDRRDCLAVMLTAEAIAASRDKATALTYIRESLPLEKLNGWGISTFAAWLAEEGEWERAESALVGARREQIAQNPMLIYTRMRLRLAMMVNPSSDRIPLLLSDNALPLPRRLRNDAEGRRLRDEALADLAEVRRLVPELEAEHADWFDAQRLFLMLSIPTDANDAALEELQQKAGQPETSILFGWLAASLDLPFDHKVLRQELARKELLGGLSQPELHAALQLTLISDEPEDVVAFLDRYSGQLPDAGLEVSQIEALRIEATARSGNPAFAREYLDQVRAVLKQGDVARLEAVISTVETGQASVSRWRAAYEASGNAVDLLHLVEAMTMTNHSELGRVTSDLWLKTRRIDFILGPADALFNSGRDTELDELLGQIGDAGDGSDRIRQHKAWAAFRAGDLDTAQDLVVSLRKTMPDDAGLRQLEINIGIEAGHWANLAHIAKQDLQSSEKRNARQLLQAAGLAQLADEPIAEELARAAVAKEPDSPEVLLGAFNSAIQRGTDWSTEAGDWLRRAIEHSGSDGPIRSAPLRELVDISRENHEHQVKLNTMIMSGELPLEISAKPLGITLSELFLFHLSSNPRERDARLRTCLPVIAGNRLRTDLNMFSKFAFDLPSILTLELVGLLDEVFEALPHVLLAAGTLPALFHDYQRCQRGQRSRFSQAKAIKGLIDAREIEVHDLSTNDGDVREEIDLARRLGAQYIHGFPIYQPHSYGEDQLDVSADHAIIFSAAAVINALEEEGEIDTSKANAARSLLGDSMEEWPGQGPIDLDRPLLLHIVSLNALERTGILPLLVAAEKKILISRYTEQQVNRELIGWEEQQQPLEAIERVRDKLIEAVKSGKASHGGYRRDGEDDTDADAAEQLFALLRDASRYDVLVSGDRAINKVGHLTDTSGQIRPIATVIDVIDFLEEKGRIDRNQRFDARQKLRECGVAFVPFEAEEIFDAASQGNWVKGPPRALRAITASAHLPLYRGALVLPGELHWFVNMQLQFVRAIEQCWQALPLDRAEAASTWILKTMPDLASVVRQHGDDALKEGARNACLGLNSILALPVGIPTERLDDYHNWFASAVGPRLGGREREGHGELIARIAAFISAAEPLEIEGGKSLASTSVMRWMLNRVPPNLRYQVLKTKEIQTAFGHGENSLHVADRVILWKDLHEFLTRIVAGETGVLVDRSGAEVSREADWDATEGVIVTFDKQKLVFDFAGLLHCHSQIRMETFNRLCAESTVACDIIETWSLKLQAAPINHEDIAGLLDALSRSPERWLDTFREKIEKLTFYDLEITERGYFDTFFDLGPRSTLSEALAKSITARAGLSNLAESAFVMAPLAVSPDFNVGRLVADLPDLEAESLASRLAKAGDPFSAVAALQIASTRLQSDAIVSIGTNVLHAYIGEAEHRDETFCDFVSLAKAVIGLADITGTMAEEPVAKQRCALLAHVGLLTREFSRLSIDRLAFLDLVERWNGNSFRLAGLVERWDERWWGRDRLRPELIAAQVRCRLKTIVNSLPEDLRPKEWVEFIGTDPSNQSHVIEMATGPLDEQSSTWQTLNFPSDQLSPMLMGEDIKQCLNALSNTLLLFEQPSDLDASRSDVLALLRRVSDDEFGMAIDLSLSAAARWKDKQLSEEAFTFALERLSNERWAYRSFVELAVASVASISDPNERAATLEKRIRTFVERRLTSARATDLVQVLDKLIDLLPQYHWLYALRTSAVLAA